KAVGRGPRGGGCGGGGGGGGVLRGGRPGAGSPAGARFFRRSRAGADPPVPRQGTGALSKERPVRNLDRLPRFELGPLPTPLDEAPRLGAALGLSRLLVKRDDLTGLALGGNKVRKLQFVIADIKAKGADIVITSAGPQSNRAPMPAPACRKAGLDCILLLAGDYGVKAPVGNLMLDEIFGAEVRFLDAPDSYSAAALAEANRIADDLRREGRKPYLTE